MDRSTSRLHKAQRQKLASLHLYSLKIRILKVFQVVRDFDEAALNTPAAQIPSVDKKEETILNKNGGKKQNDRILKLLLD